MQSQIYEQLLRRLNNGGPLIAIFEGIYTLKGYYNIGTEILSKCMLTKIYMKDKNLNRYMNMKQIHLASTTKNGKIFNSFNSVSTDLIKNFP